MSKRILVVEDQPDNRQIIRDMLAGTDYEITEAEDGEQALAAIAKQRPDLILMDIQLPIIDGYEATRRIKADPARLPLSIPSRSTYTSRPVKEGSAARTAKKKNGRGYCCARNFRLHHRKNWRHTPGVTPR